MLFYVNLYGYLRFFNEPRIFKKHYLRLGKTLQSVKTIINKGIIMFKVPEIHRVKNGGEGSDASYGNNGLFKVPLGPNNIANIVCSDGDGWEHVSVTLQNKRKCPTWNQMCRIKALFWGEDDIVVQYHPRKKDYVDCHPFCLHLWRSVDTPIITPPTYMV